MREPNEKELQEIAEWIAAVEHEELCEDHFLTVARATIAVKDDYISDGPGYCGKVIMVIWGAGPSIFNVFTYDRENKLRAEDAG